MQAGRACMTGGCVANNILVLSRLDGYSDTVKRKSTLGSAYMQTQLSGSNGPFTRPCRGFNGLPDFGAARATMTGFKAQESNVAPLGTAHPLLVLNSNMKFPQQSSILNVQTWFVHSPFRKSWCQDRNCYSPYLYLQNCLKSHNSVAEVLKVQTMRFSTSHLKKMKDNLDWRLG